MNSDRELLELAAKAAGLKGFSGSDHLGAYFCVPANLEVPRSEPEIYRWLADDGDALRLAVKLNLFNTRSSGYEWPAIELFESHGDDAYAATRRAIVLAAAAIAKVTGSEP